MGLFEKIINGKKKADKFVEESHRAKLATPLPIMILNDSLFLFIVVAYVLMGVLGKWWHPGWLVFFLIPIYYMTAGCITHKSPYMFPIAFVAIGTYLLIGFLGGYWHPYWIILFVIPLYYMTVAAIKGGNIAKVFDFLVPILVIGLYLVLGFVVKAWHPGWVVFFAIPLYYQMSATFRKYATMQKNEKMRQEKVSEKEDSIDGEVD